MPLHQEVVRAIDRHRSLAEDNAERARLENPRKHADYIRNNKTLAVKLEHAINSGNVNEEAKRAIESEIVNTGDDVARSQLGLNTIHLYEPKGSHMLTRAEYEERLKAAVRSGTERIKILKQAIGKR